MVRLKKVLLALLMLVLASQLINGLRAWRDEAVAASWIEALDGKRECLYDFSTLEARRLERLATVSSLKLSVDDRLRVDCYLREVNNGRTVERARQDFTRARTAINGAAMLGGVAAAMIAALSMFGRIGRRKTTTREAKPM